MRNTITVALFWYRDAEHYNQFLQIVDDKDELPETFKLWHKKAKKLANFLKRRGHVTVEFYSTPEEFKSWCIAHGKPLNGASRSEFASEKSGPGTRNLMGAIQRSHSTDSSQI